MSLFLIKLKNIVLDILFPPICVNCHKTLTNAENDADLRGKFICEQCLNLIKLNNTLFCPICRARLAENKKICSHSYYLLAAAGNYDDPVLQNLIHYFKYKSFENLAPILGKILIKYLSNLSFTINQQGQKAIFRREALGALPSLVSERSKESAERERRRAATAGVAATPVLIERWLSGYLIVPIPLHPGRERERGFNQAKLLAEITARHFNLPLIDGLKRIKNNKPQAKLKDFEKRIKNISGCFEIKNPNFIKGKNIILVDDVFTSGATINEAVRILKKNCAGKIIAMVIAKT
ncbi:MAG: phosphoribosyltransferase family protein [bacterium]|nr:phosphoribosyltransferase family protein [bacterium]